MATTGRVDAGAALAAFQHAVNADDIRKVQTGVETFRRQLVAQRPLLAHDASVASSDLLVARYLASSPQANELLTLLVANQNVPSLIAALLDALAAILNSGCRVRSLSRTGMLLGRRLVRQHLQDIMPALGSTHPRTQQAAFRVLTACVACSSVVARALVGAMDWSDAGLLRAGRSRPAQVRADSAVTQAAAPEAESSDEDDDDDNDDDDSDDGDDEHSAKVTGRGAVTQAQWRVNSRVLFVRFASAMLRRRDVTCVEAMLTGRTMLPLTMRMLKRDPVEVQLEFVQALNTAVTTDRVSKRAKSAFFTSSVLTSLLQLRVDGEQDPAASGLVAQLSTLLTCVCCSSADGIRYTDAAWTATGACGRRNIRNGTLLHLLQAMQPHASPVHEKLLLDILEAAPDLLEPYLASKPFVLAPRLSWRWISNMALLAKLLALRKPSVAEDAGDAAPDLLVESILPSLMLRGYWAQGMQHPHPLLALTVLRVLCVVLRQVTALLPATPSPQLDMLLAALRQRLPDPQMLYALLHRVAPEGVAIALLVPEDAPADYPAVEATKLHVAVLTALDLAWQVYPAVMARTRFSAAKLLPSKHELDDALNLQQRSLVLRLLSRATDPLRWAGLARVTSAKEAASSRPFAVLLRAYAHPGRLQSEGYALRQVIRAALLSSDMMLGCEVEADHWLDILAWASDAGTVFTPDHCVSVANAVLTGVLSARMHAYRYFDAVMAVTRDASAGAAAASSDGLAFSPLSVALASQHPWGVMDAAADAAVAAGLILCVQLSPSRSVYARVICDALQSGESGSKRLRTSDAGDVSTSIPSSDSAFRDLLLASLLAVAAESDDGMRKAAKKAAKKRRRSSSADTCTSLHPLLEATPPAGRRAGAGAAALWQVLHSDAGVCVDKKETPAVAQMIVLAAGFAEAQQLLPILPRVPSTSALHLLTRIYQQHADSRAEILPLIDSVLQREVTSSMVRAIAPLLTAAESTWRTAKSGSSITPADLALLRTLARLPRNHMPASLVEAVVSLSAAPAAALTTVLSFLSPEQRAAMVADASASAPADLIVAMLESARAVAVAPAVEARVWTAWRRHVSAPLAAAVHHAVLTGVLSVSRLCDDDVPAVLDRTRDPPGTLASACVLARGVASGSVSLAAWLALLPTALERPGRRIGAHLPLIAEYWRSKASASNTAEASSSSTAEAASVAKLFAVWLASCTRDVSASLLPHARAILTALPADTTVSAELTDAASAVVADAATLDIDELKQDDDQSQRLLRRWRLISDLCSVIATTPQAVLAAALLLATRLITHVGTSELIPLLLAVLQRAGPAAIASVPDGESQWTDFATGILRARIADAESMRALAATMPKACARVVWQRVTGHSRFSELLLAASTHTADSSKDARAAALAGRAGVARVMARCVDLAARECVGADDDDAVTRSVLPRVLAACSSSLSSEDIDLLAVVRAITAHRPGALSACDAMFGAPVLDWAVSQAQFGSEAGIALAASTGLVERVLDASRVAATVEAFHPFAEAVESASPETDPLVFVPADSAEAAAASASIARQKGLLQKCSTTSEEKHKKKKNKKSKTSQMKQNNGTTSNGEHTVVEGDGEPAGKRRKVFDVDMQEQQAAGDGESDGSEDDAEDEVGPSVRVLVESLPVPLRTALAASEFAETPGDVAPYHIALPLTFLDAAFASGAMASPSPSLVQSSVTLAFLGMSCADRHLRVLAYGVLGHALELLQRQEATGDLPGADARWSRSRPNLLALLRVVRDSVPHANHRVPTLISVFLCNALPALVRPDHSLNRALARFLLARPTIDLDDVPMFYAFFNSSSEAWRQERVWLLRTLLCGLRTYADYKLCKRRHVIELICAFVSSNLSDRYTRRLSLAVLLRLLHYVPRAGRDLVHHAGFLPWLGGLLVSDASLYVPTIELIRSLVAPGIGWVWHRELQSLLPVLMLALHHNPSTASSAAAAAVSLLADLDSDVRVPVPVQVLKQARERVDALTLARAALHDASGSLDVLTLAASVLVAAAATANARQAAQLAAWAVVARLVVAAAETVSVVTEEVAQLRVSLAEIAP